MLKVKILDEESVVYKEDFLNGNFEDIKGPDFLFQYSDILRANGYNFMADKVVSKVPHGMRLQVIDVNTLEWGEFNFNF